MSSGHSSVRVSPARPTWGRDVVPAVVSGFPVRVYADRPRSVIELLLSRRRWPERELLVQGGLRLSSAQHEQAVANVAAHLADQRVGRGDRVLLTGFNCIEWFVSFWALQSLGAVPALGNAWWSESEMIAATRRLDPVLMLGKRPQAGGTQSEQMTFDEVREVMHSGNAELRCPPLDEDEDALIMYSSGTTGAASAVRLSHRSIVANIQNILLVTGRLPSELPDDHGGTVSLMSVPLFHIGGIQTSLSTMLTGGRMVFLKGKFDPAQVLSLIERERISVWGAVPTMVSRVLDHEDIGAYDTGSLRSVAMGGAPVHPELRVRIQETFTNVRSRVSSLYGMTEAGGVLAAGSGQQLSDHPGSVGRPLPVVELEIRNPDASGIGEIHARTPTLISGFLDETTPIADQDGWVATGDLGRIDPDGWLYLTGRSKDIVIRGGENISCAHVEAALLTHPAVAEVAVVALPHPDLGEQVAAAVVVRSGAECDPQELGRHAGTTLAPHEIPTEWWLHRGHLPTNASGKVLRRVVQELWLDRREKQGAL